MGALEDFRGRVDHLTQGMPAQGFIDDFAEVWLETVMARERYYRPILCRVAVVVATIALVVVREQWWVQVPLLSGHPPRALLYIGKALVMRMLPLFLTIFVSLGWSLC